MKTHCKNGHVRSTENVDSQGNCKTCRQGYMRRYRLDHPRPSTGRKPGGNANSGPRLSPERKALLESCVLDGWPIRQIVETYGFTFSTIKKHHPDYHGISLQESGSLSLAKRHTNRKLAA